jgi:ATP-binding cassette, subfamily B, bacterial
MTGEADAAMTRGDRSSPTIRQFLGVFQYSRRAIELVWTTSHSLTLWMGALSLVAGIVPATMAYVGKWIVDGVLLAQKGADPSEQQTVLLAVCLELALVVILSAAQRGLSVCESLLRVLLGQRVNELILEKALTLSLLEFEDSEFYDRMTRARREASSRPVSLVKRAFGLAQNTVSLFVYGGLLFRFNALSVGLLVAAAIPIFIAETRFSNDAFRLFSWRAPETRKQAYLESLLAREDNAKEVTLFGLGPLFLERYRAIFRQLFGEDKALTLKRGLWGFLLGLLSTVAFYGTYSWIVVSTIARSITLGDMTLYLLVFKQGQTALGANLAAIGGMYEDNLYLSNLYAYLEHVSPERRGTQTSGPRPGEGIVFDRVTFSYPGAKIPAVADISFKLPPGGKLALVGENGAGKTTIIKLLTQLYEPTSGTVYIDGLDTKQWDIQRLRRRIGVIFQDFIHYQLLAGENVGAGDVTAFENRERWEEAAEMGMAKPFLDTLPRKFETQLGRWFRDGRELSVGQWQKLALSRAFMRKQADILVLDEPTASMDAAAEAEVFERFRNMSADKMGIVISHRFSTVRMADQVLVLNRGEIVERGSHETLMSQNGTYARLFLLQASGYR